MPVAVVGLIDEDRLWFKSKQGIEATCGGWVGGSLWAGSHCWEHLPQCPGLAPLRRAAAGERPHSFCNATLRLPRPTLMVVQDTLQDARFQHNQFVRPALLL